MDRRAAHPFVLPALIALLVIAFALGGGGSRFALANLAVQLTAIAALTTTRAGFQQFWSDSPILLRGIILASLALPLVQVVPLPESIWSLLPGRDLVARALDMTGTDNRWQTLSVDPRRTLLALTALITPLAVLLAGWNLPRHRLIDLGWVAAGLGIVTISVGAAQLAAPEADTSLFSDSRNGGILRGTFANRNSTGLLLGFALALAALLPLPLKSPRPQPALQAARAALCALLALGIILTKSRTALVLAAIPLGLAGLRLAWWWGLERPASQGQRRIGAARTLLIAAGVLGLTATGAGALIIAAPDRIGETLERFEAKDDPRRFIWDDASYAVARYWPAGAGQGTFDEVFQVDESLENLTRRRAGRAHNDYIELAVEAGIAGLVLAAAWLLLLGWLSWQARRSSLRWAAWSGSGFLLAIALQSITDYPLRNQTILAFAGLALLLLARAAIDRGREQRA